MAKRGRPPKPGGSAIWVPSELQTLVQALKDGDFEAASIEWGRWAAKNFPEKVDNENKPNVN